MKILKTTLHNYINPILLIWDFLFIMENKTGFTCNICGKIFETEDEFLNRHSKVNKKSEENQQKDN